MRPLARDQHRESWLVQLDEPAGGQAAVLVRPLDELGARRLRAEIVALHRARGTGVVSLLDVVDEEHGPGLLRAHVAGPRLGRVLAERRDWHAGEVVAILSPLVDAVARLHGNGVALGGLIAGEAVLGGDGAILVELAEAELFAAEAPEAVLARVGGVAADRESLRVLATELLRRVEGARARAAQLLAEELEGCGGAELTTLLRVGLDGLAAAVPVRPAASASPAVSDGGAERLLPVVRDDGHGVSGVPETAAAEPAGARRLDRLAIRARTLGGVLRARLDGLGALRRRALVAGGAALCAAAVFLALPGGGGGVAAPSIALPSSAQAREQGAADETTEPATVPSGIGEAAILGDDPIAAATALLERRARCFAELSLLCLEDVDQPGSAALAADRTALLALRAGDEARYRDADASAPRLIERLGAGALIEVGPETAPASLLLMKSEAGWRIRDWVAGGEG